MRYLLALFVFFFAQSAYGQGAANTEYNYDVEADMLWMKRVKVNSMGLIGYDGDFCAAKDKVVTTDTLVHDLDREYVARITLLLNPNQGNTMEARFTTPTEFVSDIVRESYGQTQLDCNIALGYFLNANTDNPLPTPVIDFENSDYVDANKAHLHYQSTMYNMELNYWTHATPPRVNYFSVSYALGLRYLSLKEIFRETFYKTASSSFFSVETTSRMWGAQASGAFEINPYSFMTWGIRTTAGILGSNLSRMNHVTDHNGETNLKRRSAHELYHGYLGELELYLKGYFLKRFNWRLGVDGIWLRGAALAPNNINLTEKFTPIKKNENIFFTSWTVGLGLDF